MQNSVFGLIAIVSLLLGSLSPVTATALTMRTDGESANSDVVGASPVNGLVNAGFEQAGATSQEAASWQPYQRGYKRVTTRRSGTWGIRLINTTTSQQAGAYQRFDLHQTEVKPVFVGAYVKGSSIVKAVNSYFGASLYVEIHLQDGTVKYWNSIANSGTFGWRWIGFNTSSIFPVVIDQPIDHIFVVPILANASGIAYFDDLTLYQMEPNHGAVTMMFDDGEVSTYTDGKAVLDNYNMDGTAAIVTDYVGDDGSMSAAQLKSLQSSGWEIVSHTVTHRDLTSLRSSTVVNELTNSKGALTNLGLSVNNFAMPFGAYNGFVLGEAQKRYRSARAFEQGSNPQGTFPYDVKVRGVIDTTTVADVQQWLADAAKNERWVVLVFHTIADTGDDAYHTPRATFESMVSAIAASGLPVVTYNEGLNQFGVNP